MVGPVIDEKVRKFLMTLFKKGGHISYEIASTTPNVLLSRSEDLSLKNITTTLMWGRSILQNLDFEGELQQPEKWNSLKEQEKKQGSGIIFELLTL